MYGAGQETRREEEMMRVRNDQNKTKRKPWKQLWCIQVPHKQYQRWFSSASRLRTPCPSMTTRAMRFPGRVSQFLHQCTQYLRRHLRLLDIYNMRRRCLLKFPLIHSLFHFLSWRTACSHHEAGDWILPSWSRQSRSCRSRTPQCGRCPTMQRTVPPAWTWRLRWMKKEGNIAISC